jgi:E3 ubiquitin-protein ligase HERC2
LRLIRLRAQILIAFNYLCCLFPDITQSEGFAPFKRFVSTLLSVRRFRNAIAVAGTYAHLKIDRRSGLAVRQSGARLESSMIGQFASQYRNVAEFRSLERPFHVQYAGENGIDVGGLARDFASELVKDLGEPRVGVFVQTPNARNQVGSFRECLVPSPDNQLRHPEKIYRALGGLLAIGLRLGMTQPYNFPPFFWEFLAGESLRPEHVFEIDDRYRQLITDLDNAVKSGMDEQTFDAQYDLPGVVYDLRAREINVAGTRRITLGNAMRFIARAHACRVAELERPMRVIREGFWENLGISIPPYTTATLLEFLICGDREVNLRELKERTEFRDTPKEEQVMFWRALARMTNGERRNLLRFSTGSTTMFQGTGTFLIVDRPNYPTDSRLPTASTCFFLLHLPPYSSVDKMYRALVLASENTDTFENS